MIDHLVLTVRDIERTCVFYSECVGDARRNIWRGTQGAPLRQSEDRSGAEIEPQASHPTPGSADLCFIVGTPLAKVEAHLIGQNIALESTIVERTGATGKIISIYLRDPDGNLIELSNYV